MKATIRNSLILGLFLAITTQGLSQAILTGDSLALVQIYNSTSGAGWTNKANWLTGRVSTWYGVYTSGNRVFQLSLGNNNLTGTIPAAIGNLTGLHFLSLSNNKLTGPIPDAMGNLSSLMDLSLSTNQLTGAIPYSFGNLSSLQYLQLNNNKLTGSIPAEIGNMTGLKYLTLNSNQLYGKIPAEIGNLINLTSLRLGNNNSLIGEIPVEIGNLVNLQELSISGTKITGQIPSSIGNMTNLQFLDLANNQLSGTIPSQLGNLPALYSLYLQNNKLSGEIPSQIANLANLSYLLLSRNQLTGQIPSAIGNMTNLIYLEISNNLLSGSIPASVSGLASITYFSLNSNNLSGSIPSELGNLTTLSGLNLSVNKLSGQIPSSLGNLSNLTSLNLTSNLLSGVIPASLGNLTKLTSLNLINNKLSGQIPAAIGNLTNLLSLNLQTNELSGSIPKELSGLTKLTSLNMGMNKLNGQIPSEIGSMAKLQSIYLNDNSLSGTLPAALLKLTELLYLRIENNNLLFEDLLPVFSRLYQKSTLTFIYMPQKKLGINKKLNIPVGERVVLTVEGYESVTGDKFQWYRNGEYIPRADDSYYLIRSYAEQDSGYYTCRISNSEVVDLYLENREIAINTELVNSADKAALLALYNATNGPGWTTKWNTSLPVYDWYGVTVTNGRVTSLRLSSNNLSGTIPSEIGQLTDLNTLYLNTNSLPGTIPPQMGNLKKLTHLILSSCKLTGAIPAELGQMTDLNVLSLSGNQLSGSIPPGIGKLRNLISLELHNNSISGPIPPELGALTSMANLILYNNKLEGSIPEELSNLKNLVNLYLYNNTLTGDIPASIARLPKIGYLMLYGNMLSGQLPIELAYLSTLRYFYIYDNLFQFSSLAGVTDYYSFTLNYQPQKKIGRFQEVALQAGESYQLEVPEYAPAPNDVLQWWRNGILIPGATASVYNISVFDQSTMRGDYYLEITNSKYPNLVIQSNMISVKPSGPTDILSVFFGSQTQTPLISYDSARVYVNVAYNTNVTSLAPSIRIPTGATINPASGTSQNFTNPVTYTVTNGTESKQWKISVIIGPNDKADISAVTLTGSVGTPVINNTTDYVELYIPYGGDPEKLAPVFALSSGAKIYPASGTVRDFTIPVFYTVRAQNPTIQKVWRVAVVVLPNTKAGIEDVVISQQTKSAVIDQEKQIVYCEVPYGTDYSMLKPVIKASAGATVNPVNLAKSYGLASEYLITSQDSSVTTSWQIIISMAANTKAEILGFLLSGQHGIIIDKETRTINVSVKKFQDLSVAMPLILISDFAAITPRSGEPVNLKDTVWYEVLAQDGITSARWKVISNIVTALDDVGELKFGIYPNPVSEILFIELPAGKHTITLINMNGKPEKMEITSQPGIFEFDLSHITSGPYLLRIETEKEVQTSVIIKQ